MSNARRWLRKDLDSGIEYQVTKKNLQEFLCTALSFSLKRANEVIDRAVNSGNEIVVGNSRFRMGR